MYQYKEMVWIPARPGGLCKLTLSLSSGLNYSKDIISRKLIFTSPSLHFHPEQIYSIFIHFFQDAVKCPPSSFSALAKILRPRLSPKDGIHGLTSNDQQQLVGPQPDSIYSTHCWGEKVLFLNVNSVPSFLLIRYMYSHNVP